MCSGAEGGTPGFAVECEDIRMNSNDVCDDQGCPHCCVTVGSQALGVRGQGSRVRGQGVGQGWARARGRVRVRGKG